MRRNPEETVTDGGSKPPKQLAEFIELANAKLESLASPEVLFDSAVRGPGKIRADLRDFWVDKCEKLASAMPADARAFLGPTADTRAFVQNYTTLKQAREVLMAIAMRKWPTSKAASLEEHRSIRSAQLGLPVCQVSIGLLLNEAGQLGLSKNPIIDALVGIRPDRIRACAICGRIFWAPRINSECCSLRCRKTYNQRNSRQSRRSLGRK